MTSAQNEPSPPKWVRGTTGEAATILDVWDGAPSVFLAPAYDGAILWWQFDVGDDGSDYILLAHLAEHEAQEVFATARVALQNPLESIRANIADNRIIIARRRAPNEGGEIVKVFEMPRHYTAEQFTDWLNEIAGVLARSTTVDERLRLDYSLTGDGVRHRIWRANRGPDRDPTAVAMDAIAATVVPV
jgi:hypothetical protein